MQVPSHAMLKNKPYPCTAGEARTHCSIAPESEGLGRHERPSGCSWLLLSVHTRSVSTSLNTIDRDRQIGSDFHVVPELSSMAMARHRGRGRSYIRMELSAAGNSHRGHAPLRTRTLWVSEALAPAPSEHPSPANDQFSGGP